MNRKSQLYSDQWLPYSIGLLAIFALAVSACHPGSSSGVGVSSNTIVAAEYARLSDSVQLTTREKRQKFKQGFVYVTKVVDGDTFWVEDGEKEVKVRFIGIDAPEARNAGKKKKGYFGKEASAYVKALTKYRWVRLETDIQERDRYKRFLAYVYLEDGTFLNAHLVENGYAVVDTHPPNVKYVDLFVKLQRDAKMGGLGLWRME
ncbi:thermonuclease family protein [Parapedobacter sp. 2B3]|uniref:thermonuclease family protein n=1 Tax=Parapedobacter sp. 2B3 TaxID=3342381 RepID=UPI0035B58022